MLKSSEAFRTISEVSEVLDTPAHVLRFWESRFPQIKPVKRAGGRRYYRPSDVALLGGIRRLLHDDGLTIRGVQKILKERGVRHVSSLAGALPADVMADSDADQANGVDVPMHQAPASVRGAEPRDLPPPERPQPSTPFGAQHPEDVDLFAAETTEAPMLVDAPQLPLGTVEQLRPGSRTAGRAPETAVPSAPAAKETPREPAAALLRAMDALRVRDNRGELRQVYLRLSSLRDRLARRDGDDQH